MKKLFVVPTWKKTWTHALALTAIIVLIPTFATGCRFGNNSKTTYKGYDLLSGYYTTEPRTYALAVHVAGEVGNRTKNEVITKIPLTVREVVTNPFLLYFDDPITGIASIRNPADSEIGFNVNLNADSGMFTASGGGTMNSGSGCVLEQLIQKAGSIAQFSERKIVNNYSARGSATVEYSVEHNFTGADVNCTDWQTDFHNCYTTSNCDDESTSLAHFIFDPFVDAGLITPSEIKTVRSLRFVATYLTPGT
jgi:hypothetical protein